MKRLTALFLLLSAMCWGHENLELLISPQEISQKVEEYAKKINADYKNEEITIIMIMKGAMCITADLMRHLDIPCTLEYIKASSYGKNGTKRGELKIIGIENLNIENKHVLIVDDIADSGNTMSAIVKRLKTKNPKSLKSLVLLSRKKGQASYKPDYILFEIENRFVVGYGLDYKEYYRGLPGVYAFINDTPPPELK